MIHLISACINAFIFYSGAAIWRHFFMHGLGGRAYSGPPRTAAPTLRGISYAGADGDSVTVSSASSVCEGSSSFVSFCEGEMNKTRRLFI